MTVSPCRSLPFELHTITTIPIFIAFVRVCVCVCVCDAVLWLSAKSIWLWLSDAVVLLFKCVVFVVVYVFFDYIIFCQQFKSLRTPDTLLVIDTDDESVCMCCVYYGFVLGVDMTRLYQSSSVWLAQLVRALAAPTHVRSCSQEVRVRSPERTSLTLVSLPSG